MEHCPQCHSTAVRRARTRSLLERVRRSFTADRLHRCHECGWRGWGEERNHHVTPAILATQRPDFVAIDVELEQLNRPAAAAAPDAPRPKEC
jgi:uncharacterized protein with PIN domain